MIEKRTSLRACMILAAGFLVCFFGQAARAATVQVVQAGGIPCKPSLAQYPTIGQAISGVPSGSTIYVCPGVYAEQLTIAKNLTIMGVSGGSNSDAAIIIPPAGGLVQNATDPAPGAAPGLPNVAAQIAVSGPATVNIEHLTVDGTGNGADGSLLIVGIYYVNASGTISYNAVRFQTLPTVIDGYQNGNGIYVESGDGGISTTTISYNTVTNYQKDGITANGYGDGSPGPATKIENNVIIGQGPTTGAAENGIQLAFGATGTITGNTVLDNIWAPDTNTDEGDAAAGILVYESSDITITDNAVGSSQFGISVNSGSFTGPLELGDGDTIKFNKIDGSPVWDGIDLCSNGNTVTSNTVEISANSGIHVDDSCPETSGNSGSSNSISSNTINTACAGILSGPSAGANSIGTNTYYNDVSKTMNTSDTCTEPAGVGSAGVKAGSGQTKTARRLRPSPFK